MCVGLSEWEREREREAVNTNKKEKKKGWQQTVSVAVSVQRRLQCVFRTAAASLQHVCGRHGGSS